MLTPVPEWISYATRLVTLIFMVMLVQVFALLSGVAVQAWHGYYRFQIGLYSYELLVRDFSLFVALCGPGIFYSRNLPEQVFGLRHLYRFPHGKRFYVGADERRHKSCSVRRHSERRPLGYVWRRTLSRVLELVRSLLVAVLRLTGDFDGDVLAARQTRSLGRKAAECGPALPRRVDIRRWLCLLAFASTGAWIWYNTADY